MAIDFPSSPTNGQIYQGYYWDNAKQAWRSNNPATGSVIMSSTTPVGATSGDMWFNTSDGTMFVYYNDGITSNWIEIQANVDNYKTPSYNYVINGGFDIWQRGTTFSAIAGGVYTADRWMYQSNITNGTITRTTDVPTGFTYSLRLQRTATVSGIEQRIESSMSTPLVGKQITVSFWAKGTGITEQVRVQLRYPTAVDNYTATTLFQQITTNVSTTWTRYSFTFNTLTNDFINGIQLRVQGISASTVALDTYFAGVQLEEGTIATPFRRNQPNIQAELAACQRYFVAFPANSVLVMNPYYSVNLSSGPQRVATTLPCPMRITPTALTAAGSTIHNFLYLPSNAGSNANYNISMSGFTNMSLQAGYSDGDNGGAQLTSIYNNAINNNPIWVNAEL